MYAVLKTALADKFYAADFLIAERMSALAPLHPETVEIYSEKVNRRERKTKKYTRGLAQDTPRHRARQGRREEALESYEVLNIVVA